MFPGELRAFHVVAQTGSIRKASEVLGVAPSSVSRKIALVEHQIGTALFERTSAGVILTHAGTLVAEFARTVVLDYESLRADLNDRRGNRRRLIEIAAVESAVCSGLTQAVSAFRSRFESISFRINTIPAPQVVEYVKHGECDFGLTFARAPDPEITTVGRIGEPVVLAVPNNHPLSGVASVTLHDLKDLVLALPESSFGIRRMLDRAFNSELGVELVPVFSSNFFEALSDFVRYGAGCAVLPQRALLRESQFGHLKLLPIEYQPFKDTTIDIITLRKRRIPRVVNDFIHELVQTFKVHSEPPKSARSMEAPLAP